VCEQVNVLLLNVWLLIARYTETAASLKDVVILLDLSGSLKEQTIEMAKETVKKIIETLGDDDYLNVIKVSKLQLIEINPKNLALCARRRVSQTI